MRSDHPDNPTRLTWWFPRLPSSIPTPRTLIIDGIDSYQVMSSVYDGNAASMLEVVAAAEKIRQAALEVGLPAFLRTDITSAKHGWENTCFLATADVNTIVGHMAEIVEYAEMGNAPLSYAFVVREMLQSIPICDESGAPVVAFHGRMPITEERRIFVRDGSVVCSHPYWPAEAIRGHTKSESWEADLETSNELDWWDESELRRMSEEVSRALPGAWSVDWLCTRDRGWVLIDMAQAHTSYHWEGCLHEESLRSGPTPDGV